MAVQFLQKKIWFCTLIVMRTFDTVTCENIWDCYLWEHSRLLLERTFETVICENIRYCYLWEYSILLLVRTFETVICENIRDCFLWEHSILVDTLFNWTGKHYFFIDELIFFSKRKSVQYRIKQYYCIEILHTVDINEFLMKSNKPCAMSN